MKIGIMGGTFDPIHNGHLMLGHAAYEAFSLDQIWFMPNGMPPHKKQSSIESDIHERIAMTQIAIKANKQFYLQEYEAGKIYLCSRTLAHAGNVQKEFQEIEIISYEQRYEIMKQCDIVVSATSAPHVVVKQEYYTPEKQVTFLDLATPRDIDPKLSDDSKVNLINLDTIKEISKANQSEREELCRQSNTMISKAKEETMQWLFQAPMEETIRSLQEKCTEIVEDSYSYLSRKIDFGTREQKLLKKVLNASLQRMIKEPIQELKHLETRQEQADYKKMVEQLFGIETKKGK